MKIAIVVGTRPEIIKMSSLIRECERSRRDYILIHSNQHYSNEMDSIFFEDLELPAPHYNLKVGSGSQASQTANILSSIEPILIDEQVDIVLVQGDTNTVLAAALAAKKLNIKVAHIEAGLRSYDNTMPEEINRLVVDKISNYLFAVTSIQEGILKNEGMENIFTVGNTVVDALNWAIEHSCKYKESGVLSKFNLKSQEFVLLTSHRPSNVDGLENLKLLMTCINKIPSEFNIIWPIHPRAKNNISKYEIDVPDNCTLVSPVGYLDFIKLMQNARFIVTDSGGIQEEGCILNTPVITIRENTERPETVNVGANILTGLDLDKFEKACSYWLSDDKNINLWNNPFGTGHIAESILSHLDK